MLEKGADWFGEIACELLRTNVVISGLYEKLVAFKYEFISSHMWKMFWWRFALVIVVVGMCTALQVLASTIRVEIIASSAAQLLQFIL